MPLLKCLANGLTWAQSRRKFRDYKRATPTRLRAPDVNGIPVYVSYRPCRVSCPEHGVITEFIPWADQGTRFTKDFNNEVAYMATHTNKSVVAEYYQISWETVGSCMRASLRLEPDKKRRFKRLRRLCA